MSKVICFASLCVLSAGLVACQVAAAASQIELVRGGTSGYRIVLSEQASGSEMRGAREIQTHLQAMSGAQLPIQTDAQPLPQAAILVGRSRHTDALGVQADLKRLGPEGFFLRTVGPHVVIVGSPVRGTMYGCSELLERLGIRWYTPRITHVPRQADVALPELDELQVPAFEYREAFFTEAFEREWAARMRFNGHSANLDESTGGRIRYYPFVHSFDELIPQSLYETHPEYFPLRQGQRRKGYVQRCLTNPDVLRLAIERVRTWMREKPEATLYSVSQNDCGEWCECEQCKALTAKYGAHSGLYLWFVNSIAEQIEKDHPDKLIDTLAYQFTEAPPVGIVPRKNVRVRLCPISVCQAHPYESCNYRTTQAFVQNLAAWSKITDTLYIWHYTTNFANYLMPFPDFNEFPADTRLYQRHGVKGIFFQGAYAPGGGGSDAELRSYVMARILWNPSRESDAIVTEWMQGVYGPAWKPMRQWFDLLHEKAKNPEKHFFIFDPPTVHYMSADVIAEGDRLFDQAEKLAADSPSAMHQLRKARLGLRYVKLMQRPTDGPEFQSFMADVREMGITQLREGQSLDAWQKNYLQRLKGTK